MGRVEENVLKPLRPLKGELQHTALEASSRPSPKEKAINTQPLLFAKAD